jgi:hypothetical protein
MDDRDPFGVTPVRVIEYTNPYDGTDAGNARLKFDTWVYGIMIVLTVIAQFV